MNTSSPTIKTHALPAPSSDLPHILMHTIPHVGIIWKFSSRLVMGPLPLLVLTYPKPWAKKEASRPYFVWHID